MGRSEAPILTVDGIDHYMQAAWRMGYELFSEGAKVTGAVVRSGAVVVSFTIKGAACAVGFVVDQAAMFIGGMGGQKPPESS